MAKTHRHSFADVSGFIFLVLKPKHTRQLIVELFLLTVAILGIPKALTLVLDPIPRAALPTKVFESAVTLFGIGWGATRLVATIFKRPTSELLMDDERIKRAETLAVDATHSKSGYAPYLPQGQVAPVVRSPAVDSMLRRVQLKLSFSTQQENRIHRHLATHADYMEEALRVQYSRSAAASPKKDFYNERKLCLLSDLLTTSATATVGPGSYFASFLTNEIYFKKLVSIGARPHTLFRGSETPGFARWETDRPPVMSSLSDSMLTNNIGMSTLVHTKDGQLAVWRQSSRAQHAEHELAPTGSGSCDLGDYRAGESLQQVLVRGMERELTEESQHGSKHILPRMIQRTCVLGYYRAVQRGGKPEFVGVSKLALDYAELEPDGREVDAPTDVLLHWPARTLAELEETLSVLLATEHLSVPLAMTLLTLREALAEDSSFWANFFELDL